MREPSAAVNRCSRPANGAMVGAMRARFARLAEIEALDPVVDHQRIVYLDACYEFPWDLTRSLELALFRTYAVPSVSRLLARTGEFTERAQKRYDDTELLIRNFVDWGYDPH